MLLMLDDACQADKPRAPRPELSDEPIENFGDVLNGILARNEGSWGQDWIAHKRRG